MTMARISHIHSHISFEAVFPVKLEKVLYILFDGAVHDANVFLEIWRI